MAKRKVNYHQHHEFVKKIKIFYADQLQSLFTKYKATVTQKSLGDNND